MMSSFNERNVPFSFLFSGTQVSWFCSNVQHFNVDPFEITLENGGLIGLGFKHFLETRGQNPKIFQTMSVHL